ncbi:CBS domain-containing protein [Vineibacter terrae]|uniref:CBS domain-containing protein n=1 Tax=Vineibacter terrae TaxID=2586908 RepID=UPI002E30968B|nr:CBS domain-containing protein [Vineibacter terrae]HEX2887971.1 CBS domain-containing protein [Vineibacter terrae]
MLVAEAMTRDIETISPDASLQQAAQKMEELDVGILPVCKGDRLQGVITDRDIIVRGVAAGASPTEVLVQDCMSTDPAWCYEDDQITAALDEMEAGRIRRLMVLDRHERLVGVLALGDIAVKAEADPETGAALAEISRPAAPDRDGRRLRSQT